VLEDPTFNYKKPERTQTTPYPSVFEYKRVQEMIGKGRKRKTKKQTIKRQKTKKRTMKRRI
jgi:hypothetical protein